jgi:FeS assembly SUF system protein
MNDSPAVPLLNASPEMLVKEALKEQIIQALKMVHDPEIPINIYDLGLIYDIAIDDLNNVHIKMTLTTPNCPEAQNLPSAVENAAHSVTVINDVTVEIVWDPPWTKDNMSEEARLILGMF